MSIAKRIFDEAFGKPRDPRSNAYKDGILRTLQMRLREFDGMSIAQSQRPQQGRSGAGEQDRAPERMEKDMELETINKLYLELSQIATARTSKEIALEEAVARHTTAHASEIEALQKRLRDSAGAEQELVTRSRQLDESEARAERLAEALKRKRLGVEWPLSLLRAGHWREVHMGRRHMRLEIIYDYATWERLMAEVESALAQQPAAVGESRGRWKPIDTAPLGIVVLVWSSTGHSTGGCMMAYRRKTDGQWCKESGTLLSELEDYEGWPTHWQELPTAPATQPGGSDNDR